MCDAQYNEVTITDESPSYISTLHAINSFVTISALGQIGYILVW